VRSVANDTNSDDKIQAPWVLKIFAIALVLAAFSLPQTTHAKYASYVIDTTTGKVLHSVNENTRNYPASLTKMMTLYLLFDAVDRGKLTLNSRLKVSPRAARQPASRLGVKPGGTISVEDAIRALVIRSANDVAVVVAENLAKSERRFALIMTDKARRIGMSRTTFRNASGLPHRGQMSTAKDMSTLARRLQKDFPQFYHYFAETKFKYGKRTYRSHNKVLKRLDGAEGMKTGYIRASGYNLVTTAKRHGHRLVGVVFGGNSVRARDRHMTKLMNKAFAQFEPAQLIAEKGSKPSTEPAKSSDPIWGVQVGAFYTKSPAVKLARKISKNYAHVLGGGQITIMPLNKSKNRILYRARILGVDRMHAYQTCRLMKKHKKPCLEVKLPGTMELAESR